MDKDIAEKLICPFQQHPSTFIKCQTIDCMAWEEDGEVPRINSRGNIDGTTFIGHCLLLEKRITRRPE